MDGIITVNPNTFDLNKTLLSGQVFGWKHAGNKWVGFVQNNLIAVWQDGDTLHYIGDTEEGSIRDYFDLDNPMYENIMPKNVTDYEKRVINEAKGIHILHQDFFETLITMMITPRNRIENTEGICNRLRKMYGNLKSMVVEDFSVIMYTFPDLFALLTLTEDKAREIGIGFRTNAILEAIFFLYNKEDFEEELKASNDALVIAKLKQLRGIGDKVANCIALFALQRYDMFPIDTHLEHIADREYGGYIDKYRFSPYAGIMQQFMYYDEAIRNRA